MIAAERFAVAAANMDRQYLPGVMPWFNAGKWEAFADWESTDKPKSRIVRKGDQLVRVPIKEGER